MVIFKHELRQLKKSIIIWSVAISALILIMLPVYIDMVSTSENVAFKSFSNNSFFNSIGTNMEILTTPIGMYSFLTFFIMFACAMNGMNMGITIMTKEYRQNSADFLMTKPWSRRTVYMSKFFASASGAVIIGGIYSVASLGGMVIGTDLNFSVRLLILIAVSTILIQLLFLAFGMLIGAKFPRIRTSLPISAGVVFFTYANGSFSRIAGIDFLGYLSPLHYFNGATVILTGGYEVRYMLLYVSLLLIFIIAGHQIFKNKDVMVVS